MSAADLNLTISMPVIVTAHVLCWSCKRPTSVIAFGGLDEDQQIAALTGVTAAEDNLQALFEERFPFFRLGHSRTAGVTAFYNHCEHCGRLQGDHYLHHEPDGPFFDLTDYDQDAESFLEIECAVLVRVEDRPFADLGLWNGEPFE